MTTDPLALRLSALTWPVPTYDTPDPARGQWWRASWDVAACLVVVLRSRQGRRVRVAAASAEQVGDESTVLGDTVVGLNPDVGLGRGGYPDVHAGVSPGSSDPWCPGSTEPSCPRTRSRTLATYHQGP
jgi:hypothetical protein